MILPEDDNHDEAPAVYNARIDRHPANMFRCRDVADVMAGARFARDHGLELAVRGGGPNAAGLGVWDDALVLDLASMRSTTVDPAAGTVRVDAGCTWGDVDHATVAFGVVTSSTFTCHQIGDDGTIFGGPVFEDLADTRAVMQWYRELLPSLPEELNGWIALLTVPPVAPFPEELWGRKVCGIVWCYTGPLAKATEVTAPVREFGSPLMVGLHEMPFSTLEQAFDGLYPARLQWYWRSDFCTANHPRLTAIKKRYDPDNLFHINQNIPPVGT